jgi:aminoglycoside phosphotransferase (APT) family kinase protein
MSQVIKAVSKYNLSNDILKKMVQKALEEKLFGFKAKELAGGLCNAVYLVEVNGDKYVAKIAPPKGALMMRHERDIISTEATMLKIMEELGIPAPRLVYYDESCEIVDVPYFLMTFMQGEPLMFMKERPSEEAVNEIKHELGKICSKISSVKGDYFGIPSMTETHFDNNADFVLKIYEMLLDDIADKEIFLPELTADELMNLIGSCREELNKACEPRLFHNDTWEGNLMVEDGKLMGLIDFAALMYGDPLMNHDFHDFSPVPNPHFLKGYGWDEEFTHSEKIRMRIYKIWLSLGMIAERGYREYEDENLYLWVLDEFTKDIRKLREEI